MINHEKKTLPLPICSINTKVNNVKVLHSPKTPASAHKRGLRSVPRDGSPPTAASLGQINCLPSALIFNS